MRKYKGEGTTYKLSSESKGDWKSGMFQKSFEPLVICWV